MAHPLRKSVAVSLLLLAILPIRMPASSDLARLHEQVAEWRKHATQDRLDQAADYEAHLAECTSDVSAQDPVHRTGAILQVGQDEYRYTSFDVGEDRFCLYMTRPVFRPLSLGEAIDVQDAQVMIRDLPIQPKGPTPKETEEAEARLAELLAAVRDGTHAPLDKMHPPSPLDFGNLVDCSRDDPRDLAAKVSGVTSAWMYNGDYVSGAVPRDHNAFCVYLLKPFNRGLNVADASDFLMAQHLQMGLSESYRRAHNIPEPADQPDLERTIKASLERFGGGVTSPTEGLPPDLIDCKDYSRSIQDNDQNFPEAGAYQWMFDGTYAWNFNYLPSGTCLVVSGGGDSRGLTAAEARAFLRAARVGVPDPKHAEAQRAQNCLAKADQSSGASIPGYESGIINGRHYRVFYAALDPDLKSLDDAQHAFAKARKEAWRQSPQLTTHNTESAFDVEIRVRTTGRTKQLATLEAWETFPGSAGPLAVTKNWMLHVPSGRLLTLEDLFVDPRAVHEQVVARYLRGVPNYLDSVMSGLAFIGDDAEQQAKDFRASYLLESHRIATTPIEHFSNVWISADGQRVPSIGGEFSSELLPDRAPPTWSARIEDLSPYFKPEFHNVLDGIHCPQMPSADGTVQVIVRPRN